MRKEEYDLVPRGGLKAASTIRTEGWGKKEELMAGKRGLARGSRNQCEETGNTSISGPRVRADI